MPRPWPDPRDPQRSPSKIRDQLFWFAVAVIGAGMVANVARGIMGMGWNF